MTDVGQSIRSSVWRCSAARHLTFRFNGTIMVSLWFGGVMPTTLTLKNIPDELYGRLKAAAEAHRRSLNSEVLVCLESVLLPQRVSVEDRLSKARALRSALPAGAFNAEDIARIRTEGRA
jgi:plasmid stability protein